MSAQTALAADAVRLGYDGRTVIDGLSVTIPQGSFTIIIGPNGCGKSTLLRGLARLLRPETGAVVLGGADLRALRSKDIARKLALLPQSSIAPEGIRVVDLVSQGRFPHQRALRGPGEEDRHAVAQAMAATGLTDLAECPVEALSGGQRQRVWVALALAQGSPHMLLDEPTTYLDIAHQIELMELFTELNRRGTTIVAVLHDLNHAARYATNLIAMRSGEIVAQGPPREVISEDLVQRVFDLPCRVIDDPVSGSPLVLPLGARTHTQDSDTPSRR